MIKEFERYHGVVLSRLVHGTEGIKIKNYSTKDNASYVINEKVGLYIKYSKKRTSPWRFSFLKIHQDELFRMKEELDNVFIVFLCHNDGMAVLSFTELKEILDEEHDDIEWVAIKRRRNEMYSVSGSDGKLKFKIGESDFPRKILQS